MEVLLFDRSLFKAYLLAIGTMLATYSLVPHLVQRLNGRVPRGRLQNVVTLAACCTFLSIFILHFGRWQFGGYDFSVVTSIGYRQILGQRPYVDFPATTPPGFNLGIKFAFECFGVNWNATLYALAIFSCVTFLWCYWLFLRLTLRPANAMLAAFAIQSAANLTLCFVWYNNITLSLAAVMFLSALSYVKQPTKWEVQASYVLAVALLAVMKPNIAGIVLCATIMLVLTATGPPAKALSLTLAAGLLSLAMLEVNHVSVSAMLSAYQGVARRGLGAAGFQQRDAVERLAALAWLVLLSFPIFRALRSFREVPLRTKILRLYFLVAPLIAIYGFLANGEFFEVECTVLLACGSVLVFGDADAPVPYRRGYTAVLCGFIASTIYLGAARIRVESIGLHRFYEARDNHNLIATGYLRDMRVSSTLIGVERQITQAVQDNAGPYFMGPSLDFNYAALQLPSPAHLPLWWEPGTAFARPDTDRLIAVWRASNFQTLVFLKDDYSYYTPALGRAILDHYSRDDRYPALTVYHLHTPEASR